MPFKFIIEANTLKELEKLLDEIQPPALPKPMETLHRLESLEDIKNSMRKFILAQTDFKGSTRANVYKKFLDGDIDTREQALEEMKMLEPDKMPKSSKKHKYLNS